jgi:hypothetical protein
MAEGRPKDSAERKGKANPWETRRFHKISKLEKYLLERSGNSRG